MDNKYKWEDKDIISMGIALKSFMLKGFIINKNLNLSEPEENLLFCANLFYESLCNIVIINYAFHMEGKKEYIIGKRQKRQKGLTAANLFFKDINDSYFNEWGGAISREDFTSYNNEKSKIKRDKIFMMNKKIQNHKLKRVQKLTEQVKGIIKEIVSLSQDVGYYDVKKTLLNLCKESPEYDLL